MAPILDPRSGDFEDDASSTKARKLTSIAGSMLAEISLPKLIAAWLILIGIPGVMLGLAPLIASAWLAKFSDKLAAISGVGSLIAIGIALFRIVNITTDITFPFFHINLQDLIGQSAWSIAHSV